MRKIYSGDAFTIVVLFLLLSRGKCTSCQSDVNNWLQGSLEPLFRPNVSELSLNWSSLERALSSCPFDHYQVELWALRPDSMKEDTFGSVDYWSQFERCTKLSPEMLRFHSLLRRTVGGSFEEEAFRHVVESEYILRICHCSAESVGPCTRACFSLTSSFCSGVIRNPTMGAVSPWCAPGGSDGVEGAVHFNLAEEHNCTSFKISGEVQTCTAVQDYDLVEVTFRPVDDDTEHCRPPSNDGGSSSSSSFAKIPLVRSKMEGNYSEYTGYFTHYFTGLDPDTKYCAQIEIKDNPYCQHEYILNHFESPPSVCSKYLDVPLRLSGGACLSSSLTISGDDDQGGFLKVTLILVGLVLLLLFLASGLILLLRRSQRLNLLCLGRRGKRFKGWLFFMESPLPNDCPTSPTTISSRSEKNHPGVPQQKVLFIYFNESQDVSDRNECMKRWLLSLEGVSLVDLNDDEGFEGSGVYSESGVMDLIAHVHTKVIIVNSRLLLLQEGALSQKEEESESLLLLEDNVLDLKLYAIDYIKTHFYANYEKVTVINYDGSSPGSTITPGRTISLPSHFNALRTWLLSPGEGGISSKSLALQKEFRDSIV